MRENPLCRAFRVDKVTLAGLEATLRHYVDPEEALREIPALRMLSLPLEGLEERARALAAIVAGGGLMARAAPGSGVVGGGTYPGVEIPSWTLRVRMEGLASQDLAAALRRLSPPVVSRVEDQEVLLDLRTVPEELDSLLARSLEEVAGGFRG
jgi:L-seryl-tRNA(Ser) seleniumtransferase